MLPIMGTALALIFATAALADDTTPTPAPGTPAAPTTETPAAASNGEAGQAAPLSAKQFIDRTYISLPESVGDYSLARVGYDPGQFAAGVSGAYALKGAPEPFTITLFVYPQGRSEEKAAVEAQMAEVEDAIRQRDDYSKIEAGPRTPFVVDAPKPSALPNEKNGRKQRILTMEPVKITAEAATDDDGPSLVELLKEASPPLQSTGLRQGFSFDHKGESVRSAGFVFYRNLYNIKLRISAPSTAMDQAAFDKLADATARALVPKVDIRNFGQCGQMLVGTQDSGDKARDARVFARNMLREQGRVERENCADSEGPTPDPVDAGYDRREIVYPDGIWRQGAD